MRVNAPSEAASSSRRGRLALPVFLVVATALVFGPSLGGDFVWDDVQLIQTNAALRDSGRVLELLRGPFWTASTDLDTATRPEVSYYRPVVALAYALEFRLFGERPVGYHAVSLFLHLACVVLVYAWLLRRLGGASPDARWAAVVGAAIFGLHPTRAESVAWISGCTDLFMTFFALLALTTWEKLRGAARWLATFLFYGLASFSKEPAILLPLCVFLDRGLRRAASPDDGLEPPLEGRRRGPWSRALRETAPLFLFMALVVGARVAMLPPSVRGPLGAGLGDLAARVACSVGHYVALLAGVVPPSVQVGVMRHTEAGIVEYDPAMIAVGAAAMVALFALVVLASRVRRARPWLADVAWIALPASLAVNIVPLGLQHLVAARFLYWSAMGLAALLARATFGALARGGRARLVYASLGGALALGGGVISARHVPAFESPVALWSYERSLHPENLYVLSNLAFSLRAERRTADALGVLAVARDTLEARRLPRKRLELDLEAADLVAQATPDDDPAALSAVAAFYDDLAGGAPARLDRGGVRLDVAPLSEAERSALVARSMTFVLPRARLALRLEDLERAARLLRAAALRTPDNVQVVVNLGLARARAEAWDEAQAALARAKKLRPSNGRIDEALRTITKANEDAARGRGLAAPAREALRVELLSRISALRRARAILDAALRAHPGAPELVASDAELRAREAAQAAKAARSLARPTP